MFLPKRFSESIANPWVVERKTVKDNTKEDKAFIFDMRIDNDISFLHKCGIPTDNCQYKKFRLDWSVYFLFADLNLVVNLFAEKIDIQSVLLT